VTPTYAVPPDAAIGVSTLSPRSIVHSCWPDASETAVTDPSSVPTRTLDPSTVGPPTLTSGSSRRQSTSRVVASIATSVDRSTAAADPAVADGVGVPLAEDDRSPPPSV
jgi:hypothetical protein